MHLARLSLNSLWLLISRIGAQAGLAVFTILVARGLGAAGFGEYAFIAAVIVVGNVLTTFGTDMLLIREIAATDDLSQLSAALVIQLVLSVVFIGAVLLFSAHAPLPQPEAIGALRIYSLSMLPLAFFTVFTTALRGRQHMLAYAGLNLALMILQVIAAAWLVWRHANLVTLAELLVLVQVFAAILAGGLCFGRLRGFDSALRLSLRQVMPLARASAPIALLGLLGVIYQRLSLIVLPAMAGSAATGWFSSAARIIEAAKVGHLAAFTALYPMMAQVRRERGSRWARTFQAPVLILLAGAGLASVAIYLLAQPITLLLFGAQYLAAIPVLRILAWMLIPFTLNSLLTLALLADSEERIIARALALSICVLSLLMLWWVPTRGIEGAAWAVLCAEVAQCAVLVLADAHRGQIVRSLAASGLDRRGTDRSEAKI